jgi:plastocyanin
MWRENKEKCLMQVASTRNRALANAPIVLGLLMLIAARAHADQVFVDVGGDQLAFSPSVFSITTNDTVTFVNKGGFHNVTADNGAFRCAAACDGDGSGKDGSPAEAPWSATVSFPAAGTFGFHCEIHGVPGAGMFGTVTVVEAPPPPPTASVDSAPYSRVALSLIGFGLVATAWILARRRRS